MKTAITALLVLLVVAPALGFQQKSSESLTRISPENCGLSLELPTQSAPSVRQFPIPEDLRGKIFYAKYSLVQDSKIIVLVAHLSAIEFLKPKGVAEGTVHGLINRVGLSDLHYSTEPSNDSQAALKGTYTENNTAVELNGIILSKEKHTWSVVCIYKQSNKEAQELGQRVLASISLNGSPCPEK
jgi:hypothetical protein